jgi:hypothetical protein
MMNYRGRGATGTNAVFDLEGQEKKNEKSQAKVSSLQVTD